MKNLFRLGLSVFAISFLLTSCEDPEPPNAEIFFEASQENPYEIHFSAQVQNVTSYSWDFADGNTSIEAEPVHTYAQSGDYVVSLTVSGEGGDLTVTKDITIAASFTELLTGGPSASSGKTWKMSTSITPGLDGAGHVASDFPASLMPGTDNMLEIIGLGEEYDNEYTFFHDGTINIDTKNGYCLAAYMYSIINDLEMNVVTEYGLAQSGQDNVSRAGWTLTEDTDLVVESINEIAEGIHETITFASADYLTLSNEGFVGILDFTPIVIVRQISADRMVLACFLHGNLDDPSKPTNLISFSLDTVE